MVGGFILHVARQTIRRPFQSMIEVDFSPIVAGMAGSAISSEVGDWLYTGVTGFAQYRRARISAAGMATLTRQSGVLAGEREEGVQRSGAAGWECNGMLRNAGQAG